MCKYKQFAYLFIKLHRIELEESKVSFYGLRAKLPPAIFLIHSKEGASCSVPFTRTQVNLLVRLAHYPFNAERQAGKL